MGLVGGRGLWREGLETGRASAGRVGTSVIGWVSRVQGVGPAGIGQRGEGVASAGEEGLGGGT